MTTGAGSLNPAGDENDVAAAGVETGAGLKTTGTGVTVGVAAGDVMPVAGVDTAGTGIGMGTEAGGLNAAGTAPAFAAVGSGVLLKETGLAGAAAGASGAGFPPVAGAALPGSVAGAAPAPLAAGGAPCWLPPCGVPCGPPSCWPPEPPAGAHPDHPAVHRPGVRHSEHHPGNRLPAEPWSRRRAAGSVWRRAGTEMIRSQI